jgi:hypothetical protein
VHVSIFILLVRTLALFVVMSAAASAEQSASAEPLLARPDSFDSATLLRHVIAALLPTHGPSGLLERSDAESELDVDFASGNEHDRVSVSLADSELRVRLGEELRLHCEVSSRDELEATPELDGTPELGIDLAIRFKFQ